MIVYIFCKQMFCFHDEWIQYDFLIYLSLLIFYHSGDKEIIVHDLDLVLDPHCGLLQCDFEDCLSVLL